MILADLRREVQRNKLDLPSRDVSLVVGILDEEKQMSPSLFGDQMILTDFHLKAILRQLGDRIPRPTKAIQFLESLQRIL